jgi:hypothetical protein
MDESNTCCGMVKQTESTEKMENTESVSSANAHCLERELEWLSSVIDTRLRSHFANESPVALLVTEHIPDLSESSGTYADFIRKHDLSPQNRIILLLSLVPYIRPALLDVFLIRNTVSDKRFTEFGGATDTASAFIPTGETALFVLAGTNLEERFRSHALLGQEGILLKEKIIRLETANRTENPLNGRLLLERDYLDYFITGEQISPEFGDDFPARLIRTPLEWEDVVLQTNVRESVEEISEWVEHGPAVLASKGLGKRLKPGYKCLFYGPPGTGKTMTAALIGKTTGHAVYKIDLSLMVSKYIGETEKNLAKIFDLADNKNWILFFDEADALFGKRTEVNSSHDRFANQEVAYLLQRIEEHNGVVILASNLKDNIDQAFTRRFQSIIHFPMPGPEERFLLWSQSFAHELQPDPDVDLRRIAEKYEIAGGVIMNVLRYSTLKAIRNGRNTICLQDIEAGIRRELQKEGIVLM